MCVFQRVDAVKRVALRLVFEPGDSVRLGERVAQGDDAPGESSGPCKGGTASGTFWLARTLGEATNANARIGPALPSLPY